jgi:hypothetical protein
MEIQAINFESYKLFNSFSTFLNVYTISKETDGNCKETCNVNMNTKNNDYFGISLNANPLESYDFYEPEHKIDTLIHEEWEAL